MSLDPFMATRASAIPADLKLDLRGPADADHFRVKVGRYGDRWYHDPMPADDIAPAWDGVVPSVSTAKKASGNDWSFVALKRVATAMDSAPYDKLAQWKYADRYEGLKAINKNGLNGAAKRGTNVHLMAEAHLYGQPCPIREGDPGFEYRGAVDQFFDQYQPTLVAAEFVCIHRDLNGAGYGGTADAILEIDAKRYLIDWKSRGADSEHGAYPEEGAQIGAYARAGYTIAEGDFGPERRNMPDLDGGLIVSIMPDGCRVYPIDLDAAFAHWDALHAWWVARQDERKAVGRQWVTRKAAPQDVEGDADPGNGSVLGVDANAATPSPSTPLAGEVEACGKPPDTSPVVIDSALWAKIDEHFDELMSLTRVWIGALANQANRHGLSFNRSLRTERAYHIARGLIGLCLRDAGEDEILRAILLRIYGDEMDRRTDLGYWLGALDDAGARSFADLVDRFNRDDLKAYLAEDHTLRLFEPA